MWADDIRGQGDDAGSLPRTVPARKSGGQKGTTARTHVHSAALKHPPEERKNAMQWLQENVEAAGQTVQALFLMLGGAIPFIESYGASAVGVIAGIHPVMAVLFAVIGNIVSMTLLVLFAERVRKFFTRNRDERKEPSKRQQRFVRMFEKYGVAGVSILGQAVLPSQITSSMMAGAGVAKGKIIFWQCISIVLWGVLFAGLASAGLSVITGVS